LNAATAGTRNNDGSKQGKEVFDSMVTNKKKNAPIHPGEILLEEFLKPMNISQYRLAKDISVPARRINEIVLGKRSISADTTLRLSRYFRLSERFWLNLQSTYDLAIEKDKLEKRIQSEVRVFAPQRTRVYDRSVS
jgi:antitoxin HigA-1